MTLLPRSLFGRLALLLLGVVAVALVATILFFRQDRLMLLARQFSDTKIVQLQAVRAALEANDTPERRESIGRIAREYGVRIVPESERPFLSGAPVPPLLEPLHARLREALGEGTELRVAPGRGLFLVRVEAAGVGYWVGFPLPPRAQAEDHPSRAALSSLVLAAVLLAAAFVFARYLARPLRELATTVEQVGRGETPPPLPEHGPSEIVTLNRGVNRMAANLRQLEQDRALLLAGVSHDLRTPLARLRLGVEMQAMDEATRAGMVDDIGEMDRIIGQFLEFARTDEDTAREPSDLNAIVGSSVERYVARRQGRPLRTGHVTDGAAAPHGILASHREPDRQRHRLRRAAGGRDDPRGRQRYRARRGRSRPGHRAGRGRAAETAVHAGVGRSHQRGGRGRCRTRARHCRPHRPAARRKARSPSAGWRRHRGQSDDSDPVLTCRIPS